MLFKSPMFDCGTHVIPRFIKALDLESRVVFAVHRCCVLLAVLIAMLK